MDIAPKDNAHDQSDSVTGPANRRLAPRGGRRETGEVVLGTAAAAWQCTWQHRRCDLVRLPDGSVGFVRNGLDAEISRAIAEAIEELFGPEPAEGG
jgi:hypothetical protein